MKRLIPRRQEVAAFAVLAILFAVLATFSRSADLAMAFFAIPTFIFAAWMGMRRSGQWFAIAEPVLVTTKPEPLEEEPAA